MFARKKFCRARGSIMLYLLVMLNIYPSSSSLTVVSPINSRVDRMPATETLDSSFGAGQCRKSAIADLLF